MKSDETLMAMYRDGSEEAFALLYEKYSDMIYAFVKKRIRESEVDDVFQKVWRRLHEKRSLYQGQPFLPWLFVVMRNLIIDEYRSLSRLNKKEFQDSLLEKSYGEESQDVDVEELLSSLSPDTRDLVRKYYLEGASYEDLEKEVGMSQAGLRQRLSRAMRSLRKSYEK